MTTSSNLPTAYVLKKKNTFVEEYMQSWGATSDGIEVGHYVEGIILGFELNMYNMKHIIIRQLHDGSNLKIWGCTSLQKQLHQEQVSPFNTLIYNVGDVVRIIYTGSYVAKKGMAAGKTIAGFAIRELDGYQFTEEDMHALEEYAMQQAYKHPMQIIKPAQQQPTTKPGMGYKQTNVTPRPKALQVEVKQMQTDDEDSFDI